MKFAGGLLTMAPRCHLRREEVDPIYDGGYSYPTYEPSPPPPPPSPPVDPWEQYQTPPYIPPLETSNYTPPAPPYVEPTLAEAIYYSLPYVDPETGASVILPHFNATTGEFFGPGAVEVDTTNDSDSPTPITGPDSPFAIFADAVQRAIGGSGGAPVRQPQAPALVPVSTGGGGINAGALLIVLALIGGAVWWFFFRKKKGVSDGG